MLETHIEKFIVSGCCEEVQRYRNNWSQSSIPDYDKNQWTYIVEIMIITIKSLVPCDSSYGSVIDYKRFNEEFKLWYYYRHGENNCLLGCLNNDEKAYWEYEDDSIFSRIVPIVFANENWMVTRDEVLKNILYTTGKISSIFEGLTLAKLLFILISNVQISYDDLISQIKEEIVCFSQKEFIQDYTGYFKFSPSTYKSNYNIEFERKRIELLNVLNGIGKCQEYNTLKQSLDILQEPEKNNISYDDLISQIKEEIVCFSQKEFIQDYTGYFKFSPSTYKSNYNIEFERKRIELLNVLNGIGKCQEYNTLKQSLDILQEPEKNNEQSSFFIAGLKGLKTSYETNPIKDEVFIKNLCSFLVKLRKGRISVESLQVEKYILPDVFQYKEGDVFFHTLLKKCQVIKIIKEADLDISFIRTKTGAHRFWKRIKN